MPVTYDHPTSQLKQSSEAEQRSRVAKQSSEAELYAIIENGTDAEMRGAARAELEVRSY